MGPFRRTNLRARCYQKGHAGESGQLGNLQKAEMQINQFSITRLRKVNPDGDESQITVERADTNVPHGQIATGQQIYI
jgi:hypothetical protein